MLDLQEFVAGIKIAVVEAAHQVRQQNLDLVYSYFDIVPPALPDEDDAWDGDEDDRERPRRGGRARAQGADRRDDRAGGRGGRGGRGGVAEPAGPPVFRPKMVAFQYPVETEDGPMIHTATVPIISLLGTHHFEITEFRLNLRVCFAEDGTSRLKLGFPGGPAPRAEASAAPAERNAPGARRRKGQPPKPRPLHRPPRTRGAMTMSEPSRL